MKIIILNAASEYRHIMYNIKNHIDFEIDKASALFRCLAIPNVYECRMKVI